MTYEELVLIHEESGEEYRFESRAEYLAAFYSGGYREKGDSPQPRRSAPAPMPGTPQARPVPVEQQS